MIVDTDTMVSIIEANQNFSKVSRLVDAYGSAGVLKNNVPRYLVLDFSKTENDQFASDEDIMALSARLIKQNKEAYQEFAKRYG